jgi:hypothetical protein
VMKFDETRSGICVHFFTYLMSLNINIKQLAEKKTYILNKVLTPVNSIVYILL